MVKLAQAKKEPQKTKPYEGFLPIGCHVSAAGGVFNAPKNLSNFYQTANGWAGTKN
jgi:hypothetical protein